jgi:hypothetical protein
MKHCAQVGRKYCIAATDIHYDAVREIYVEFLVVVFRKYKIKNGVILTVH